VIASVGGAVARRSARRLGGTRSSARSPAARPPTGRRIRRAELDATARPLRLAYADPPYPGLARRYYRDHPDFAGEVDHGELLSRLQRYDGWAQSTSVRALPMVLARCVAQGLEVRVAAWFRGARSHALARIVTAWEPVVYAGGRRIGLAGPTVTDALVGVVPRRRTTLPTAVIGDKPPEFCRWVFELLGAGRGDTLDDLYPGSGMVSWAWEWLPGPGPVARVGERRLGAVVCPWGRDMSLEILHTSAQPELLTTSPLRGSYRPGCVRTILLATAAERELRRLPPAARPGIRDGLHELAAEAANLDVVALRGRSPWLRLRLGDWRVLFRPVEEEESGGSRLPRGPHRHPPRPRTSGPHPVAGRSRPLT
jgi:mRNA-degrading endonuclease RelE of RelBE toxin-antitoxin system